MTRGIFIVGNESALSRAVEAETLNRVEQFAAALIPNRFSEAVKTSESDMPSRLICDWNPSSPISARTVVIAAENRLEHINEAILICSPPSIRSNPGDLPLSAVEIMINDHIKCCFFLVKEITKVFKEKKRGTLALVYPDIASSVKDDAAEILGPSALASFRALTQGLLTAAHREPYLTMGFSTSDAGNEAAFAAFMFKIIDEAANKSKGKMHKFGKFKFF
jgi:hypothetical protein